VEVECVELGDGFDFSVTVAGEGRGVELVRVFAVVVRRGGGVAVTVLPGVVTVSEDAVVVVVVVVVWSP
jgi:hypothetical protein